MKNVIIYVNSQFGIGHFQRCFCILRAIEERHADVNPLLIFGGLPYSGFEKLLRTKIVRLPGLTFHRSDDKISYEPRPVAIHRGLQDVLDERRELISEAIRDMEVEVVFLEYFPFSKQSLASEVDHLLSETSKTAPPTVVTSLRDFITIDEGFDRDFVHDFIAKHCSYILVHADPHFAELQTTYGDVSAFRHKIRYTGYVVDSRLLSFRSQPRRKKIVAVSVGGGKDGELLLRLFLEALQILPPSELASIEFRVFRGPFLHEETANSFSQWIINFREYNIRLCPFEEYRKTILECSASLSMCGYNTAVELTAIRVPHIWFMPRRRTEQLMRGDMLSRYGLARILSSPREISEVLREMLHSPFDALAQKSSLDFGGADRTADLLQEISQGLGI